jgi:hypothetical protein
MRGGSLSGLGQGQGFLSCQIQSNRFGLWMLMEKYSTGRKAFLSHVPRPLNILNVD